MQAENKRKRCVFDGCDVIPSFNVPGGVKTARFCKKHKTTEMLSVTKKTCVFPECQKQPSYNAPGKKSAFCAAHKSAGMVFLRKTCVFPACQKRPSFNVVDAKTPKFCSTHHLEGMIDVKHKRCIATGCQNNPNYNLPSLRTAKYCLTHKVDGMDIKNKRCAATGCQKCAMYNLPGVKTATFCKKHKSEQMVNVLHKRCVATGCQKYPNYNLPGLKPAKYCLTHKVDGMEDVKNKRCVATGCQKYPIYNLPGLRTAKYCSTHKIDVMVNVITKTCINDWCETMVQNSKYEGYCLRCFMHTYPDKPVSQNYKTKERLVVDFVLAAFPLVTWVTDKRVADGCSRRRPDLLCDVGEQVIIVEVDENQHDTYNSTCENKRLMELSQDVGHRPIVFVRFNPDEYVDITGVKHTSCFGTNKKGIMGVKKNKRVEWAQRLEALRDVIQHWMRERTTKTVEVVSLFFNDRVETS